MKIQHNMAKKTKFCRSISEQRNQGLETGEEAFKFTVCSGEAAAQCYNPAPGPLIFHGKNGEANNQKQDSGKHGQQKSYGAQQEQGPSRHDQCYTLHHLACLMQTDTGSIHVLYEIVIGKESAKPKWLFM
jgi:hypothetical protein